MQAGGGPLIESSEQIPAHVDPGLIDHPHGGDTDSNREHDKHRP